MKFIAHLITDTPKAERELLIPKKQIFTFHQVEWKFILILIGMDRILRLQIFPKKKVRLQK